MLPLSSPADSAAGETVASLHHRRRGALRFPGRRRGRSAPCGNRGTVAALHGQRRRDRFAPAVKRGRTEGVRWGNGRCAPWGNGRCAHRGNGRCAPRGYGRCASRGNGRCAPRGNGVRLDCPPSPRRGRFHPPSGACIPGSRCRRKTLLLNARRLPPGIVPDEMGTRVLVYDAILPPSERTVKGKTEVHTLLVRIGQGRVKRRREAYGRGKKDAGGAAQGRTADHGGPWRNMADHVGSWRTMSVHGGT